MAIFGVQLVITMVMASILSKLSSHFSFGRWLLCEKLFWYFFYIMLFENIKYTLILFSIIIGIWHHLNMTCEQRLVSQLQVPKSRGKMTLKSHMNL